MTLFRNTHDTKTIKVAEYDDFEPGETRELSGDEKEAFGFYIERGDLETVEGEEPEETVEEDDEGSESDDESGDEADADFRERLQEVKHVTEELAEKIAQDFEDFERFKSEVTSGYLEGFKGIGPAKSEEMMEDLE